MTAGTGTFTAAATWSRTGAVALVTATSRTFTPGTAVWASDNGQVAVTATSGVYIPGPTIWTGSTAVIEVVADSGTLVDSTPARITGRFEMTLLSADRALILIDALRTMEADR